GLFRSTDQGATWTRLNDDAHEFAGAPLLVGDMNVAGRVYMSAGGGRGLIYWEPAACTPTAITPYVNINNGTWQQTANASLAAGGSVQFGPQPTQGGSWSWTGPNNFSAATREIYLSNVQSSQAGNYVATYTNSGGCKSTQTFNITLTGSLMRSGMSDTSAAGISQKISVNEDAVSIYPNPASEGRFSILLKEIPAHAIVRVYDNQGRMLYERKTQGSNKIEVDARLNAGFYIVTIDSNGSSFTKKLIVH
ncbi:MAG TPA: T9SS type A sorting domain-containing protein, partial [Chitinophaga sp.]|uniref:T9SS type A sorting domain-containing protein n=1 Tax=Chitinophaga sp. TaxID=1869181 RepID=UPI002F952696